MLKPFFISIQQFTYKSLRLRIYKINTVVIIGCGGRRRIPTDRFTVNKSNRNPSLSNVYNTYYYSIEYTYYIRLCMYLSILKSHAS